MRKAMALYGPVRGLRSRGLANEAGRKYTPLGKDAVRKGERRGYRNALEDRARAFKMPA